MLPKVNQKGPFAAKNNPYFGSGFWGTKKRVDQLKHLI
jgi:hypothetical protein